MDYTVILFYKYVTIADPEAERQRQRELCKKYGLTGRVIVAEEGINATLEGTDENIQAYITSMKADDRFADIDFKRSPGTGAAFPKLSVKAREEIVASDLGDNINPTVDTGTHITPDTLHEWFEKDEDFTVVDMRNDYEVISGKFEKTRHPGMRNFREIHETHEEIEDLKDKKVVAVCTGGIRCEKATAFLKKEGFSDVHQLQGGIHRYIEKYPDGHYKGALYVFDGRMTIDMADDPSERGIVGECFFCGDTTEQYVDDDSVTPSRQLLCCDNCFAKRSDSLRLARKMHAKTS
ncbi:MAG: rhodanese-related sulfurtransferase [Candidatus Paceibacterota bacterium]